MYSLNALIRSIINRSLFTRLVSPSKYIYKYKVPGISVNLIHRKLHLFRRKEREIEELQRRAMEWLAPAEMRSTRWTGCAVTCWATLLLLACRLCSAISADLLRWSNSEWNRKEMEIEIEKETEIEIRKAERKREKKKKTTKSEMFF